MKPKYPIFLDLNKRLAVVIGAGSVAARKVHALVQTGAKVRVVTKNIESDFQDICRGLDIEILQTDYDPSHLNGALLVIAATDDNELNRQIYNDCQQQNILCNVVDVPELCNFFVPSVVRQGHLQIAISTNGKCPAYAAQLRRKLEQLITKDHADFLEALNKIRQKLVTSNLSMQDRKSLLEKLVNEESFGFLQNQGIEAWMKRAENLL